MALATVACCAAGAAATSQAQAAACGGLLQPKCATSPTGTGTGGTTTTPAACGGLFQPKCPAAPTTGTGGGGTTTTAACGGLFQPKCTTTAPKQCGDGVDNDKDGLRDLADAGCASVADVSEYDDLAPDANGLPRGADVDPRTSGKRFGFNTFLGEWQSGITPAQEVELIKAAGGDVQRFSLSWAIAQPSAGYYRADRLWPKDQMYNAAVAAGITPIITIMGAPVWASDIAKCGLFDSKCRELQKNPPDYLPPAVSHAPTYGGFAAWVAARYPAAIIETWNEPNIRYFWSYSPFPDAGRMAAMQCAVYDAVKALDPSRVVLSPGFAMIRSQPASGQIPYVDYLDPMHTSMGRRCWDGLSTHIYPHSNVDGEGSSTAMALKAIRAIRTRHGDSAPIWVTETGASTSGGVGGDHGHTQRTDAEQLEMMRWTINEFLTTDDIGAVLLHTLRDRMSPLSMQSTPSSTQYGFGALTEGDGPAPPPKPLWCHLVGATGVAYSGCASGEMTVRATTLRSRELSAQSGAKQMTKRMQRRR